jgi:hypothetical protein
MRLLKPLCLLSICLVLISCEKNEQADAILRTLGASNVTAYSATIGANITAGGELPVLARGITWSKEQNPTIK